jgi:fucose permease
LGLWSRVASASGDRVDGHANSASEIAEPVTTAESEADRAKKRTKALRLQVAIYVTYTSCEFLVGLWSFSLLTMYRHVDPVTAGAWVSVYYGSLTAARFVTGVIVNRLGNRFMIKAGLILALAGVALYAMPFFVPGAPQWIALIGLVLIGAGFGPVYPCMTHETPRRFTEETSQKMIGYQTGAASLSGAIFPALVGLVGAHTTFEILPFVVGLFVALSLVVMTRLDRLTERGPL